MNLGDYLKVLWRRRWFIVLGLSIAATLSILIASREPSVYQASAKVFIGPQSTDKNNVAQTIQELSFSRDFIASYAELLQSRDLAQSVVERLNLSVSPTTLAARVVAQVVPDTRIIVVSLTDTDSARVAKVLNTITETFILQIQQEFGGKAGVRATVFDAAVPPTGRVSPHPFRNGVLGGMIGLMLGAGLALVLEQLDTRIRTREDLERTLGPVPILAEVPEFQSGGRRELTIQIDPKSPVSEAFRILRTNVQFLAVDRPLRRLIVTSPHAEDGKTTVSSNLAASLAAAGYRTLLMETDLRRPTVHDYFHLSPSPGLADVLVGRTTLVEATRQTAVPNLSVLTSGPLPPNPSELLGSQRMADIIEQVSESFDTIVLDTPPTLPVADATVLAPRSDGVIVVVRAGKTHRERARETIEQFERIGVQVLGLVLNGSSTSGSYYYYYGRSEDASRGSGRRSSRETPAPAAATAAEPSRTIGLPVGGADRP